jgi:hypothetical protein
MDKRDENEHNKNKHYLGHRLSFAAPRVGQRLKWESKTGQCTTPPRPIGGHVGVFLTYGIMVGKGDNRVSKFADQLMA